MKKSPHEAYLTQGGQKSHREVAVLRLRLTVPLFWPGQGPRGDRRLLAGGSHVAGLAVAGRKGVGEEGAVGVLHVAGSMMMKDQSLSRILSSEVP